jgi:SEC-C motif-containing protein
MNEKTDLCPCDSGQSYSLCCAPFLQGKWANTAEQLMRSRYTAYVISDETYLLETWHKNTRPQTLNLSQQQPLKWIGLKVLNHIIDVEYPDQARVEFVARYKVNGKAEKIHESSRFKKQDGRWFYVDGDFSE